MSLLLLAVTAIAAPVAPEKAQQLASQFMQTHRAGVKVQAYPISRSAKMMANGKASVTQANYYIFNTTGNQGYVIVSGDDRTTQILGFTDSGSFDPNNMPANMKVWLENYEKEIQSLDLLGITGDEFGAPRPTRNSISPMITTHWDQATPYWNHCPEFMSVTEDGDTVGEFAYTGCVATSMAQIMNFHRFPLACTKSIPSYLVTYYDPNEESYGAYDTETLDPIYFDWDNMRDTYTGAETEAEKEAVSWLMLYAGCAAQMQYGMLASSTSDPYIPTALNEYFNYDAKLVYRSDYEQADWEEMIYQELAEGRPMIYNGRAGTGGGHSFVCDGYAYGDYFHINWGWGGLGDGYFVLSVLNPYAGGIGAASSSEGYNIDQTAIIGIIPGYSGQPTEVDHRLTVFNMYYTGSRTFDRSDDGSFKLTKRRYVKVTAEDHIDDGTKYLRGIALYDSNDNFIELIAQTYYGSSILSITDSWPDNQSSITYPFGADITSGTYKIVPVCCIQGTNEWQPMLESDRYYIEATISNDQITLADHPVLDLQSNSFEFTGGEKVGTPEQCHVTVKNNSADRFSGKLYLYVSNEQMDEYSEYTTAIETEIPAGGTKMVTFNFTPQNAGSKSAYLSTYDNTWNSAVPGTGSVTIEGTESAPMNLSVEINALGADTTTMTVYDSYIKFKVDVTNHNTVGDYTRYILAPLFYVDEDGKGEMITYLSRNVNIAAGETQTFYFEFDNLAFGSRYALNIFGRNENDSTKNLVPPGGSKIYTIQNGMVVWTGDGTRLGYQPYEGITVPENAAAVSFADLGLKSVTANNNPNTLYYFDSTDEIPSGLDGKNIIQNNVAQGDIVLKHGYNYYAPYRFRANNISYERTFTRGRHAGQEGGWSTMVLPFTATSVTADGVATDWMHSKTDAKTLWVCNYDTEEEDVDEAKLYAEYMGSTLEANVPYFVAPYDGSNGTDMRNKTYVFSAENVLVKPNPSAITSGTYHMVIGDFIDKTVENAYFLNAAGSHFVKGSTGSVNAFEAYADNVKASDATQFQIVLDENAEDAPSYLRGDVDNDGNVDIADVTALIDYLLSGNATNVNLDAADCDQNGEIAIKDVTSLIDYLLNGAW